MTVTAVRRLRCMETPESFLSLGGHTFARCVGCSFLLCDWCFPGSYDCIFLRCDVKVRMRRSTSQLHFKEYYRVIAYRLSSSKWRNGDHRELRRKGEEKGVLIVCSVTNHFQALSLYTIAAARNHPPVIAKDRRLREESLCFPHRGDVFHWKLCKRCFDCGSCLLNSSSYPRCWWCLLWSYLLHVSNGVS